MAGNANYAITQATRPYIALLHHDDICRVDLIEKWLRVISRHDDVGFVFNAYGVYNSDFIYQEDIKTETIQGYRFLEDYLLPRWGCPVRGTAMIRRSAWETIEGMKPQFGLLADIDLWMRLSMLGRVGYVNEPILTVRHERPDGYPVDYTWSWERQIILYDIHAKNRINYLDLKTARGRIKWWVFRIRLSLDIAKWLTYSVVRSKPSMLSACTRTATPYALSLLWIYRWLLLKFFSPSCPSNPPTH
jgi:GT2 family glycosyltransferase